MRGENIEKPYVVFVVAVWAKICALLNGEILCALAGVRVIQLEGER